MFRASEVKNPTSCSRLEAGLILPTSGAIPAPSAAFEPAAQAVAEAPSTLFALCCVSSAACAAAALLAPRGSLPERRGGRAGGALPVLPRRPFAAAASCCCSSSRCCCCCCTIETVARPVEGAEIWGHGMAGSTQAMSLTKLEAQLRVVECLPDTGLPLKWLGVWWAWWWGGVCPSLGLSLRLGLSLLMEASAAVSCEMMDMRRPPCIEVSLSVVGTSMYMEHARPEASGQCSKAARMQSGCSTTALPCFHPPGRPAGPSHTI